MEVANLFADFGDSSLHKAQAIFSSIFILQNRMQTAGEKLQTEISMKQWLLLALLEHTPEPKTYTNIGKLMGCSRQNVKKLASALQSKGFVKLIESKNNSICVEITPKAIEYQQEMSERHLTTLKKLFSELSDQEIDKLFNFFHKLYIGLEQVEQYTEDLDNAKKD